LNAISNIPLLAKILLPILVVITLWFLTDQSATNQQELKSDLDKASDYAMKDFTMTIMNAEGHPFRVISGKEMDHYPADDSTEIISPIAQFIEAGKDTWVITSNNGSTVGKGNDILLTGHVIVTQENHPDTELRTEKLNLDTVNDTAYTDLPVSIKSPQGITHSVGLHADLKDKTINLHSRVKGHYDAPPTT